MSAVPLIFPLQALHEELIIPILLNLDPRDLVKCQRVSRWLFQLIRTNVVLQYKLHLTAAGMVDGGRADLSYSDRLERLRAYRRAWSDAEPEFLPFIKVMGGTDGGLNPYFPFWRSSDGVLPYRSGSAIELYRPPSTSRGIPERWWTINPPDIPVELTSDCAVDIEQDLIVLLKCDDWEGCHECHLRSISLNGAPHPLAMRPMLTSSIMGGGLMPSDKFRILGDLLLWRVYGGKNEEQIWNWKTGILLWHLKDVSSICLLDTHHVLVTVDYSIRIYAIDPTLLTPGADWQAEDAPSIHEDRHYLCSLQMPPVVRNRSISASVLVRNAQSCPPSCSGARPVFISDAANAVVAVTCIIENRVSVEGESHRYYNLFLPLSTIFAVVERAREHSFSTLDANVQGHKAEGGGVDVPWDDWGPKGTRFVKLKNGFNISDVCGSRVAAWCWTEAPEGVTDALVFDLHPYADLKLDGSLDDDDSDFIRAIVDEAPGLRSGTDGEDEETLVFQQTVHTSFPWRITRKQFRVGEGRGCATCIVTEDALAMVLEHLPGSYEGRSGPDGYFLIHT